jgi:hypothetical protein
MTGVNVIVDKRDCQNTTTVTIEDAPISEKLHVIMVISNPCEFKRRWQLAEEFIARMDTCPGIILYKVEVAYPGQEFRIALGDRSLQLRAEHPIWHKETMINAGIKALLPKHWKKVAWIDADIEFESFHWVSDTLRLLDVYDIVQMFSHALDLDKQGVPMDIWQGAAYQYCKGTPRGKGFSYWHPGYAWACTRKAYEKMGKLFDVGILGSGDDHMFRAWTGDSKSAHGSAAPGYHRAIQEYTERSRGMQIGYVPGVIRHYFHGSKKNRRYVERWQVLIKYQYDPYMHVQYTEEGLMIPNDFAPIGLLKEIMKYFQERNEDE